MVHLCQQNDACKNLWSNAMMLPPWNEAKSSWLILMRTCAMTKLDVIIKIMSYYCMHMI